MGAYINPIDIPKEEWLANFAIPIDCPASFEEVEGALAVCLVDNGMFTAAGICFDQREFDAFVDPRDERSKQWYLAGILDLYTVSNLEQYRPRRDSDHNIFTLKGAL